nr:MAG: hypothetical protein ATN33_01110 [Epulopiscium sp. Nele67-Bin001]
MYLIINVDNNTMNRLFFKFNPNSLLKTSDINDELRSIRHTLPDHGSIEIPSFVSYSEDLVDSHVEAFYNNLTEIFSKENGSLLSYVPVKKGKYKSQESCYVEYVTSSTPLTMVTSATSTNVSVSDAIFTHTSDLKYAIEGDIPSSVTVTFKSSYQTLPDNYYYVVKCNGEYYATKTNQIELTTSEKTVSTNSYLYVNGTTEQVINSILALKYMSENKTVIKSPVVLAKTIHYIHIDEYFIGIDMNEYPLKIDVDLVGLEPGVGFKLISLDGSADMVVRSNNIELELNDESENTTGKLEIEFPNRDSYINKIVIEEDL